MKLNLRSVDLNLFPVFEAIMEQGSLSMAASHLGMSQPAASAALKRLRLTLKDELFVRTRRGLEPTARALELYPVLHHLLESLRGEMGRTNQFDPAFCERIFKVAGGDYFDMVFMGRLMNVLRESAPKVQVESVIHGFQESLNLILRGKLDLCLHYDKEIAHKLPTLKLFEESMRVLIAADHPYADKQLSLSDYIALEHVVLPKLAGNANQLDVILGGFNESRCVRARVSSVSSMVMAIKQSHLVGTTPTRMANILCEGYGLVAKPFPKEVPPIPIYLSWAPFSDQDSVHGWFRNVIAGLE
ncbi:MAG: DNA-binding transcriptional LysR family regulator [Thalassolituus sp.]|jgi:DNA-binding transcriptional LysR family regulator